MRREGVTDKQKPCNRYESKQEISTCHPHQSTRRGAEGSAGGLIANALARGILLPQAGVESCRLTNQRETVRIGNGYAYWMHNIVTRLRA